MEGKTIGSLDDTFRHQISKMADLHFVEREVYKKIDTAGKNLKILLFVDPLLERA